jgi:hypothetical protein
MTACIVQHRLLGPPPSPERVEQWHQLSRSFVGESILAVSDLVGKKKDLLLIHCLQDYMVQRMEEVLSK